MSRLTLFAGVLALFAGWMPPAAAQVGLPPYRSAYGPPTGAVNGYSYAAPSYYYYPVYPVWGSGGYPVIYGEMASPGYYWPRPLRMSEMPGSPLSPPADALPAQRSPWADLPPPKADPALRPVVPSTAAARVRALNLQAEGDQYVRQQKWQHAYSCYKQAISLADDLAETHLRYGIVFAVMGRYDRAAMEFRRATHIDPTLPSSAFTLASLLGPDSQLSRASILSRISAWVGEDVSDPDRQYVLGVLLHFNQDERAQELFSAAARLTNGAEHIVAYLPKVEGKSTTTGSAPVRNRQAVDAPPKPGLEEEPAAPKVQSLPPAPKPKADPIVVPKLNPTSAPVKPIDPAGPVLLPPLPE